MREIASEIGLTAVREVRRCLRSAKGLLASILFLLGGAVSIMAYRWINSLTANLPEEVRKGLLSALYKEDPRIVDYVVGAPNGLLFLHNLMLFFLPVLAILLGFDQIAGEREHGTLRFTSLRARRFSIVIGRALGNWANLSLILLGLWIVTCGVMAWSGEQDLVKTLRFAGHFWAISSVYALAPVGQVALMSSLFRRPVLALLSSAIFVFGSEMLRITVAYLPGSTAWMVNFFPSTWWPRFLVPELGAFALGAGVCLLFSVLCLVGASGMLQTQDL